MRRIALALLALPGIALAQTAQTNCYQTAPTAPPGSQSISCTTQLSPAIQIQSPPPLGATRTRSFAESFERGRQDAQRAALLDAQRRNLELQNQLLQQQIDQQNAQRRAEQLAKWKAEDEARAARRAELDRQSAELLRQIEERAKKTEAKPRA